MYTINFSMFTSPLIFFLPRSMCSLFYLRPVNLMLKTDWKIWYLLFWNYAIELSSGGAIKLCRWMVDNNVLLQEYTQATGGTMKFYNSRKKHRSIKVSKYFLYISSYKCNFEERKDKLAILWPKFCISYLVYYSVNIYPKNIKVFKKKNKVVRKNN